MTAPDLRRPADLDWTLGELVERRAAEHGDRIVLRGGDGQAVSYAELAARVAGVRALLAGRGLQSGDRVAIVLANSVRYPIAWLGVASAGMTAVPVNKRSGPSDARYLIDHSGARMVLVDDSTAELAATAIAEIDRSVMTEHVAGDHWPTCGGQRADPVPPVAHTASALANIQYTSGTTGFPKGCMLSHRFWQQMGQGMADVMGVGPDSVLLTAQPFSYIDPLWNTVAALRAGAELVVLDGFHPSTFMRSVTEFGVTVFYCLAAMPTLLLKQPPAPYDHDHRLQRVYCSAIPPKIHADLERRWGVPWSELFGMTETGLNLAVLPDDHDELVGTGSMGAAVNHCEARVVDVDGVDVADGQEGELLLRGLGFMDGYLDDPDATAAFFADGWAHTGDIVVRDAQGRFTLRGRRKDMIRRGGENIAAAEVEATLVTHPAVLECAITSIPDDDLGEELRAIVVPVDGAQGHPDAAELRQFLSERLAAFKVPRYWEFRAELPKTPSQRVAKRQLGPPGDDVVDLSAPCDRAPDMGGC